MRLYQLLAPATFGLLALHCSSPERSEAEPTIVENRPGALVITSPSRAAFIEGADGTVAIKGTGATDALRINGKAAKVSPDGSFEASVAPSVGLNLIVAVDGESRLETPFLYGHFAPANEVIAKAIAIEVGQVGIEAPPPNASITTVINLALEGRDLLETLRGKTLTGEVTGATWQFTVTGGRHKSPNISLNTANKGLGVTAIVSDVVVEGTLTMRVVGLDYTRAVRITVDRATILAESELSVDDAGALKVAVPSADAFLDGFRFASDNGGFPCCVDSIVTGFLQPKVQEAIRDGIREQVPSALALTLDGVGLPKELDFTALGVPGLPLVLGVDTKLDTGAFDQRGGVLTASARFDGRFGVDSPGAKAPGWLAFGRPFDVVAAKRTTALGVSLSLDAVNQLMFAAWGSGKLAYTSPPPFSAKLTPALPPVVTVTPSGALRLGLGEIRVQRPESEPLAAATVLQDVSAKMEGDVLVLAPEGQPTISITWLADDNVGSGKNLVALAAKEQLDKFLKPFRIPVPRIALDKLGGGFVGQSLAIKSSAIALDRNAGRLGVSGAMVLVK